MSENDSSCSLKTILSQSEPDESWLCMAMMCLPTELFKKLKAKHSIS